MRKISIFTMFILIILILTSCTVPDENSLFMTLNPGIDTVGINESFTDAGAKAQYGFKNLNVEVIENTVDTSTLGTYLIVYYAIYLDFESSITRYVTVVDDVAPVVSLNPGVDTIFIGSTWTDTGIYAVDNSMDTVEIEVIGTVNTMVEGEYQLVYKVSDSSGNVTTIIRFVNVLSID
jgi:hypothetical protein